jgi:hypothetical protein
MNSTSNFTKLSVMKRLIYTITLIVLALPVVGQNSNLSHEEELVFAQHLQLLSFTSSVQNNVVHLNWSTAWEKDFDSFIVERAANNMEFKAITKVKGKGSSNESVVYSFTDNLPLEGQNYYRLKTTGLDGSVEYHKIISGSIDGWLGNSTEAYPKVVNEHCLKLETSQASVSEIRLFDLSGQMVYSCLPQRDTDYVRLPEQVKPGKYLLVVFSNAFTQHQEKIMVL